jgi:hypothetical protein
MAFYLLFKFSYNQTSETLLNWPNIPLFEKRGAKGGFIFTVCKSLFPMGGSKGIS